MQFNLFKVYIPVGGKGNCTDFQTNRPICQGPTGAAFWQNIGISIYLICCGLHYWISFHNVTKKVIMYSQYKPVWQGTPANSDTIISPMRRKKRYLTVMKALLTS